MAILYLAVTLGYMGAIYWLSSLPGDVDPEPSCLAGIIACTPPTLQNLLHIPLFGLLAWLWYRTLGAWNMRHEAALFFTLILAAGFGLFDEWHQLHVPGRYASFTDISLNCAGVVLTLWWIHRRMHRKAGSVIDNRPAG